MNLVEELEQMESKLQEYNVKKAKQDGKVEQAIADLEAEGFTDLQDAKISHEESVAAKKSAEEEAVAILADIQEKFGEFLE